MRGTIVLAFALCIGLSLASCGSSSDDGDDAGGASGSTGKGGTTGKGGATGKGGSAGATGDAGATGESGGAGGGGPLLVDEQSFPALYAALFCAAQGFCCSDAGGELNTTCEVDVESAVEEAIADQTSAPNLEFSEERAAACIAALGAATGCDWVSITAACRPVIVGTVAGGDTCDDPLECAPPAQGYAGCAELGGDTLSRCRQFDASAGEGDNCVEDHLDPFAGDEGVVTICGEGLYCDGGQCVAGIELGETCATAYECARGYCIDDTCQEPALGETCDPAGAPCAIEGECIANECVPRPLLEQIGATESCSF